MYKIIDFNKNEQGKDYVIGDIHGMVDTLYEFLASVNFDFSKDRLFSVGDLIDRGKHSYEALKLTREPWFHAILGNHEVMLLTGYMIYSKDWYKKLTSEEKEDCLSIIKDMPLGIELETSFGNVGIIHAQFPMSFHDWNLYKKHVNEEEFSYDVSLKKDKLDVIRETLWGRKRIYNELKKDGLINARKSYMKFIKDGLWNRTMLYKMITYKKTYPYLKKGLAVSWRAIKDKFFRKTYHQSYIKNITYTIHGHTPVKTPLLLGNQFFIDTGAVYGIKKLGAGSMTMIEIGEQMKFHNFKIKKEA